MISVNVLIGVCAVYVTFLFGVAFAAERAAAKGRGNWLRSPLVYTLSLSIYCTAWTFYGAVGYAVRSGMEFVTIYLGPSLVMIGWWWILRKLVRIGRTQRVTSVADLISARYGKSNVLAIIVTLMAVLGVTPYIALQLQSVMVSLSTFARPTGAEMNPGPAGFWVALGLAFFTVLFGTRNLNANERHDGVVMAVAVEAVVKLIALLAVGIFVVWGVADGVENILHRIDHAPIGIWQTPPSSWMTLTVLSGAAFLCLPRMFQVLVVENDNEHHLHIASWAFPIYLLSMSLFVIPIAVVGLEILPAGSNPDLFVLTIPLSQEQGGLAVLSFLGGFSSATSMVIVATLALSTMVSNHVVMPIWLSLKGQGATVSGDVRDVVIFSRRMSILGVTALGYLYYRLSGGTGALASIGLVSFIGVAQFLPAILGGIFWRGATRIGALLGLGVGFSLWFYTSLLPGFGEGVVMSQSLLEQGPFGLTALRPQALFGIVGLDPTVHAVFWTLFLNTSAFVTGSLFSFPKPLERLQGAAFVNVFAHTSQTAGWSDTVADSEDLLAMAQRILGGHEAQSLFRSEAQRQGRKGHLPDPTPDFLQRLEGELSASVGAATAHAMIRQLVGGVAVSVEDLMAVADESAQMLEYSTQLEIKSAELSRTARQLREVNSKLTQLSVQKDAFLSQISHELRTPMTSIRSFSEILRDTEGLEPEYQKKYASIIHVEALRLTRLLDDLLDLSVLENGQVSLNPAQGRLCDVIGHAILATQSSTGNSLKILQQDIDNELELNTDLDRLAQVFINLISNAQKYCNAPSPTLTIKTALKGDKLHVHFSDNGKTIPHDKRMLIFEKFSRINDQEGSGAGLGLAICREILARLGGDIFHTPLQEGNRFTVVIPLQNHGPQTP